MDNWHIRLEQDEAVDTKKQLLSSEIDLLHLTRHIKNYAILSKRELILKNKLKANMTVLKAKINFMISTLPKESTMMEHRVDKVKNKLRKEEAKNDYQRELEEIQAKLARLG